MLQILQRNITKLKYYKTRFYIGRLEVLGREGNFDIKFFFHPILSFSTYVT
jgi:hypothetical protein